VIALAILMLQRGPDIGDTIEYQQFHQKLVDAKDYSVTFVSQRRGQSRLSVTLDVQRPGRVRLRNFQCEAIWDGKAGVYLNHKTKTFYRLPVEPDFGYLAYTFLIEDSRPLASTFPVFPADFTPGRKGWISSMFSIDAGWTYSWFFDPRTFLLAEASFEERGVADYAWTKFKEFKYRLSPPAKPSFDLVAPPGYQLSEKEKEPGSVLYSP
jgi:hypothetical protein